MEKYMGYRAAADAAVRRTAGDENRELPVFNISGTDFTVDITKHELRQRDDPYNRMSLGDVKEEMGFSHLLYDTRSKNLYTGEQDAGRLPAHVHIVILPPLKDLDPVGLARKHGLPDQFYGRGRSHQEKLTAISRQAPAAKQHSNNKRKSKKQKAKKRSV